MITPEIQHEIDAAIARARLKPIPLERIKAGAVDKDVMKLSDRKPGFERGTASESVLIPRGFRAAISFEQQPPGLCRHLSVSVDTPGSLPNQFAVWMIAEAFGIRQPKRGDDATITWLEEFDPGHFAVNLVALDRDMTTATATGPTKEARGE